MNLIKKTQQKILAASIVLFGLIIAPGAQASGKKLSSIFEEAKNETTTIVPIIMSIGAAGGAIVVMVAMWSIISAKKNREPLTWQVWGVIGGALVAVAGAIMLAVTGSLGLEGSAATDGLKLG